MQKLEDVAEFKTLLLGGDYGVDSLVQIYQTLLDFEDHLKWANPFFQHLRVVSEVLEERYPEMWVHIAHLCPTRKAAYRKKLWALMAVARIQRESDRPVVPIRVYQCPYCQKWHLTSQSAKTENLSEREA